MQGHPAARRAAAAALGLALALASAAPAAAFEWGSVRGHAGFGYAARVDSVSPGGSLSVSGGLDVPVAPSWRAGFSIGYHLLGGETVELGSLAANVEYSAFEAMLLAHWMPERLGPLGRVSFGPGLMHGSAEISATGGGGAAFRSLARSDAGPALGVDATLMPRRDAPVRVGLELSLRRAFLDREDWTVAAGRLVFHY